MHFCQAHDSSLAKLLLRTKKELHYIRTYKPYLEEWKKVVSHSFALLACNDQQLSRSIDHFHENLRGG